MHWIGPRSACSHSPIVRGKQLGGIGEGRGISGRGEGEEEENKEYIWHTWLELRNLITVMCWYRVLGAYLCILIIFHRECLSRLECGAI